jgi:hypothetical protein
VKATFFLLQIQTLFEDIPKLLRVFDLIKALTENKHLHLEPYVSDIALYDRIKERWPIQFYLLNLLKDPFMMPVRNNVV